MPSQPSYLPVSLPPAPPESFDELIRATRSGGYMIFSVRTDVYEEGGFKDKQEALEREGRWQLVEVSEPFSPLRYEDPELKAQVFAYQVHQDRFTSDEPGFF